MDTVDRMDLSIFYTPYREDGWGAAAYDPRMMVGVLLPAYCQGMRSSRKIARTLERDIGFRVVAANQQPDFRIICRFRAEHEEELERLLVEVLRLCREAGLVNLADELLCRQCGKAAGSGHRESTARAVLPEVLGDAAPRAALLPQQFPLLPVLRCRHQELWPILRGPPRVLLALVARIERRPVEFPPTLAPSNSWEMASSIGWS